ncbi:MAG: glutathione S-transferase, partial [Pseudomonadales bacterium]|nr:glutathione S-transferase [Pseudomonadales bacterium]
YDAAVDTLAKAVTTHEYIAGSEFTAADVYVGSHVIWGQQFGSLPKRKAFQDYAEKLMQRPAYKAAQEK